MDSSGVQSQGAIYLSGGLVSSNALCGSGSCTRMVRSYADLIGGLGINQQNLKPWALWTAFLVIALMASRLLCKRGIKRHFAFSTHCHRQEAMPCNCSAATSPLVAINKGWIL